MITFVVESILHMYFDPIIEMFRCLIKAFGNCFFLLCVLYVEHETACKKHICHQAM